MTRSLYSVLNVAPNADPAVIEAAYKALMKKYHPDVLTGAPSTDQQKAAEINQAFQVLRDPDRRARYDSGERARQDAFRRAAMAAAPPPVYHAPPPPRRGSRWPKLILAAVVAGALFLWWQDPEAVEDMFGSSLQALAVQSLPPEGSSDTVRVKDIDLALEEYRNIKRRSGLRGLSAFSEDCFASQSRAPTARALDYCVAFDHAAAAYGARISGDDLPQLLRFRPDELEIRHESAARLVSIDDGWIGARRAQLKDLTLRRLQFADPSLGTMPQPATPPAAAQMPMMQQAAVAHVTQPKAQARRPSYRSNSPAPRRSQRGARSDRDFLEREGYIY